METSMFATTPVLSGLMWEQPPLTAQPEPTHITLCPFAQKKLTQEDVDQAVATIKVCFFSFSFSFSFPVEMSNKKDSHNKNKQSFEFPPLSCDCSNKNAEYRGFLVINYKPVYWNTDRQFSRIHLSTEKQPRFPFLSKE
ncbi:hypothetical protein QOT17_015352 [Balamuthia mandrillaris]